MRFRVAAVTTLVGLFAFSVAAQDRKLVIVIDTFENPANYRNSTIGNALTDMFITSLSRTGTFTIMDTRGGTRDQVDADLYLSAKVTNFSYFEDEVAVATADRARSAESATVFEQTMSIRIDITAVDDSQEIIFADMVEHTETNTSATAMATNYRQLVAASVSVNEMTNSMMGRATVPAIDRAVERVTTYFDIFPFAIDAVEGRIVGVVDSQNAVIDRGLAAGLHTGDELEVLREEPILNADGEVVFSRTVTIGRATTSEVQANGALITVTSNEDIREGDIVLRGAPESSAVEHVTRGTKFLNAAFPAAALKEYRAARELDQESVELFFHLGMAYWGNQPIDSQYFSTALESFYDFLDRGEPLELVALHRHTFGSCVGIFTLTRDSVSYQSPGEEDLDHFFDVPLEAIVELRRRPEAGYSGTLVVIRAPSAEQVQKNEGKTKNWTLYFQPTSILGHTPGPEHALTAAVVTTYLRNAGVSR